jgi:hypothetical protein
MAFALVYGAEHYVFDIVLGWLLAGGVSAGFSAWESRRSNRGAEFGGRAETDGAAADILGAPLVNRP